MGSAVVAVGGEDQFGSMHLRKDGTSSHTSFSL